MSDNSGVFESTVDNTASTSVISQHNLCCTSASVEVIEYDMLDIIHKLHRNSNVAFALCISGDSRQICVGVAVTNV